LYNTIYIIFSEVIQRRPHDKSADVYSLGATMYFMLKGRNPKPKKLLYNPCESPIVRRMMCQRREERLKLEDLEIRDGKLVEKTSN
jgi:serine/threonine protein kinase